MSTGLMLVPIDAVQNCWDDEAQSFANLVSLACECDPEHTAADLYHDLDDCPDADDSAPVNDVHGYLCGIEWTASLLFGFQVKVAFPEPEEEFRRFCGV